MFCRHIGGDGDFSDDFHVYAVEWTKNHLKFTVNGNEVGTVTPPNGGFWQMGGFQGNNIWANGAKTAPFDKPVKMSHPQKK